jgi:hypothetical protein
MATPQSAFEAARNYIRNHPDEIPRAIRNALGLRVGVPFEALRWLAKQAEKSGKVSDLQIDPVPPGVRAGAVLDAMGTPLRAAATLYFDRIVFNEEELVIALRVEDISLKVDGEAKSPVGALIKSGALDLSNIGTLVSYMPNRPPIIAEAGQNRVVLDLMRDPNIGRNELVRRAVAVLTSFVTLSNVQSDPRYVDIAFRAFPDGLRKAARSVRHHVILPGLGKLLTSG